jgi:hypothetical protein
VQFRLKVYLYSATPRMLLRSATIDAGNSTAAVAHGRRLLDEWKDYGAVNVVVFNANDDVVCNLTDE